MNNKDKKITNEKPISLAGVDFKELLKAFLKIIPDEKGEKKVDHERGKESKRG